MRNEKLSGYLNDKSLENDKLVKEYDFNKRTLKEC